MFSSNPRLRMRVVIPPLVVAALLACGGAIAGASARDPANDELRARIVALEQRLGIAPGETVDGASLDQRLRIIERKLELQDEVAAAKAAKDPVIALDADKGLSVKSADGAFQVKLRSLIQADGRFFANGSSQNDGFLLRRVEPSIEGSWGKLVSFRINAQLAGDSATLNDAYIDLKFDPRATLRIGKAKPPLGLERLQSSASTSHAELGLPSELAPGRDIGVQLQGDVFGGALNYGVGVYNGTVDGRDAVTSNPDGALEYVGRLFLEPFKNSDAAVGTLGIGIAASVGDTHGSGNNFLPRYRTPGQEQFFGYGSNIAADGEHLRKTAHGYYYRGAFGVLGEYITSSQELRVASGVGVGGRATLENQAWQVSAGYVLTGEDAGFRGVAKPSSPFAIGARGSGALELVGRYGRLDIDADAFTLFANANTSASAVRSWGIGLNWYLTQNIKLVADYTQASFDGGAAAGADRPNEKSFFTRAQLSF